MKDNITFTKSSFSGTYNCVGIAKQNNSILLTNTKNKDKVLEFTQDEWDAFKKGILSGEFDMI